MGYVDRNLVPGETLLYRTRHHWLVLLGPAFGGLLLLVPGMTLLVEAIATGDSAGLVVGSATISPKMMALAGAILLVAAIITFSYGVAKRNATEMAVTNRYSLNTTDSDLYREDIEFFTGCIQRRSVSGRSWSTVR